MSNLKNRGAKSSFFINSLFSSSSIRTRKNGYYYLIPFLILSSISIILLYGCTNTGETKLTQKESAPDFTIDLFNGGSFSLSNHKGKPILINFWASWCIPCRGEAPTLEKVYQEYRKKGVEFIGIAVQDTEKKARQFIDKYKISFPVGLDDKGVIRDAYRVYGIPTTYIIDKEGKIIFFHIGGITEEVLRDEMEKLL